MKVTVVGDSVAWGQGLLDTHKYSSIVNQTLGLATPPLMLAHSGATIGIRGATPFTAQSGEVPTSSPTVLEQVAAAPDPADTQVVLMNGLQSAVRDCGDARVSFADAGFTERNAACNVAYPLPLTVV